MRSQTNGSLPLAHQLESLIKSMLDGYGEGYNEMNGDKSSVEFQMPMTSMKMDIYTSEKRVLDKMLKEGSIDEAQHKQRLDATPKGKVKVAYLRLEKHTTTLQYRPMDYKDWVPGNVVQKLDTDVKGWSEVTVPEDVDIPEGMELAKYRVEYRPVRKDLLYHTQYPFMKKESERTEPWKQTIYYRVIAQLVMGGIEYSEALYRMEERKKMEKVAAEETAKTVSIEDAQQIQPVKTMRQEQPPSKDDKAYLAWLAKQRKEAGIKDPKPKKK